VTYVIVKETQTCCDICHWQEITDLNMISPSFISVVCCGLQWQFMAFTVLLKPACSYYCLTNNNVRICFCKIQHMLKYLCNKNQFDVLFIFSLFRQSTSTCFRHICGPSSGGILYMYNNCYMLCWKKGCLKLFEHIYISL